MRQVFIHAGAHRTGTSSFQIRLMAATSRSRIACCIALKRASVSSASCQAAPTSCSNGLSWSLLSTYCGTPSRSTTVLGVAIARFGFELDHHFEDVFHWSVAALLVGLGGWLAFRAPHGRACQHCQGNPQKLVPDATDRAALWGLFLTLTLSPCELFLPVYLTAAPYGWPGVIWLSLVLAAATFGGMLLLTALTLHGTARLRWRWLREPSPRLIGGLLAALGIATVALPHSH